MHPAIREKLASLRERHDELNGLLALPETAADATPKNTPNSRPSSPSSTTPKHWSAN